VERAGVAQPVASDSSASVQPSATICSQARLDSSTVLPSRALWVAEMVIQTRSEPRDKAHSFVRSGSSATAARQGRCGVIGKYRFARLRHESRVSRSLAEEDDLVVLCGDEAQLRWQGLPRRHAFELDSDRAVVESRWRRRRAASAFFDASTASQQERENDADA
jgi:hypothetical protein